jgi:hypothetical protein
MPLPRIDADTPVVTPGQPAVAEKTYPDKFIVGLNISTDVNSLKQSVTVSLRPYNYDTQELMPQPHPPWSHHGPVHIDELFVVDDIESEAGRVPLLAQTMGMIVVATKALVAEKSLLKKMEDVKISSEERTSLEAHLVDVRKTLGM